MAQNERDFWGEYWNREPPCAAPAHASLIHAAESVLGGFEKSRILEVGAGRAVDAIEMARRGAKSLVADLSNSSFNHSLPLATNTGVTIIPCRADAERLPFSDGQFNLVFSQGLMEHPGLMKRLLPEQIRVTAPQGFVLIDVPQLFSVQAAVKWLELMVGKWPFGPETNYSERMLKKIVADIGLEYVSSYGRELVPMVNLGIRKLLTRLKSGKRESGSSCRPLPVRKGLMTSVELSWFGPKFFNNIGIIARKP